MVKAVLVYIKIHVISITYDIPISYVGGTIPRNPPLPLSKSKKAGFWMSFQWPENIENLRFKAMKIPPVALYRGYIYKNCQIKSINLIITITYNVNNSRSRKSPGNSPKIGSHTWKKMDRELKMRRKWARRFQKGGKIIGSA